MNLLVTAENHLSHSACHSLNQWILSFMTHIHSSIVQWTSIGISESFMWMMIDLLFCHSASQCLYESTLWSWQWFNHFVYWVSVWTSETFIMTKICFSPFQWVSVQISEPFGHDRDFLLFLSAGLFLNQWTFWSWLWFTSLFFQRISVWIHEPFIHDKDLLLFEDIWGHLTLWIFHSWFSPLDRQVSVWITESFGHIWDSLFAHLVGSYLNLLVMIHL